jgi:hypothetical protein
LALLPDLLVRLAEWVPPVGGALSGHTSTWQAQAAGIHRPSDRRGRRPEASSRGDAKQPRGAADRARIPRGVKIPPSEFASYAHSLGLRFLELCSECAALALRTGVEASPNKLAQKGLHPIPSPTLRWVTAGPWRPPRGGLPPPQIQNLRPCPSWGLQARLAPAG